MIRVRGWNEEQIRSREDVFEALVTKAIKLSVRTLTTNLTGIITAAVQPSEVPPQSRPVFTTEDLAVVTAVWSERVSAELLPYLVQIYQESANQVLEETQDALSTELGPLTGDMVTDYLATATNRMVGVGDLLWRVITEQLGEGYAAGESTQQLATRLRDVAGLSTPRALNTARTEIARAANAGSFQQMISAGFTDEELEKEWFATEDERTRPAHALADEQRVPITQSFHVGGEYLPFPAAPNGRPDNVINCRCTLGFVFSDDATADVDENVEDEDVLVTASMIIRRDDISYDPLTAAADEWTPLDEQKHPRDSHGRFAKKKGISVPNFYINTPEDNAEWIIALTQSDWDSLSSDDKTSIEVEAKYVATKLNYDGDEETAALLEEAIVELKAGATSVAPPSPVVLPPKPLGVATVPTLKKPIHINTKVIYGTNYGDKQVVAVKPSDENNLPRRLVWNASTKKFELQAFDDEWLQLSEFGKGDAYKKFSKETGWFEPDDEVDSDFVAPKPVTPSTTAAQPTQHQTVTALTTPTADGWPDSDQLAFTGKTVGTHGAKIYRDKVTGKEYLFKSNPGAKFATEIDVATAALHKKIGLPTPDVRHATVGGTTGSLQEMIPGTQAFTGKFKPGEQSQATLLALLKEQVFDWAVSNFDSHSQNFVRDKDGKLVGVDKGQAFKYLGADKLDAKFWPNEHPPIYNAVWDAFVNDEIMLPNPGLDQEFGNFILNFQKIDNAEYRELLRPYAEAASNSGSLGKSMPTPNDVDAFLDAAVARKMTLLKDFGKLYGDKNKERLDKKMSNLPKPTTSPVSTPAPGPVVNTPSLSGVSTSGALKPIKLNTKTVYTTKYSHMAVVAQRTTESGSERIVWNEKLKKFLLQRRMFDDDPWLTWAGYTKKDVYEKFSGDTDWKEPPPGGAVAAPLSPGAAPTPSVSGVPTWTSPAPTVAPTPSPSTTSFDIEALKGLGDINAFTSEQITFLGSKVKYNSVKALTLKSQPSKIFESLVNVMNEWNATPGNPQINVLHVLKSFDQYSTPKTPGVTNQQLYEKMIVEWLKTPSGKVTANKHINATPNVVVKPKPTVSSAPGDLKDLLPPSAIGTPNASVTEFEPLSLSGAAAMQKKMKNWSPQESHALSAYTGSAYGPMNNALRKDPHAAPMTAHTANLIKNAQSGMAPVTKNFMTFRGTSLAQFGISNTLNGGLFSPLAELTKLIGKTITDKGFVSTSISPGTAFSGGIRLNIKVPEGTPGAYVKSISLHSSENEFILAAGTKFIVESVKPTGLSTPAVTVTLRVVP